MAVTLRVRRPRQSPASSRRRQEDHPSVFRDLATASARTTLLQLRESGKEEARTDADEVLYVVAGEGTLRLGNRDLPLSSSTTAIVPRGTVRGLTRKGRNPLIVLSVVSGPPCTK